MKTFQPIEHITTPELVKRKIRQASAPMFVREFTQNAIEAAKFADIPRVKWWEQHIGNCRKLAVWNNGRGMDAEELLQNMNLGASGPEKIQSAADNFGLGAKLTGLKAHPAGLLWRSCKDGVVNQIMLGWRSDEPGIIGQPTSDGGSSLVLDVSELYRDERLSKFDKVLYELAWKKDCSLLDFEWTLVVFLGRSLESQDTVDDPFGEGAPLGGTSYWLPKRINRRYYDLAPWTVTAICHGGRGGMQSRSCPGLKEVSAETEAIVPVGDASIRYCLLKKGHKSNEEAKGYNGHAALIFRNEIFDGLFDGVWNGYASRFGIFAGTARIAVHVLLCDDFPATPNEQRDKLEEELPFGDRKAIVLENYELLVEQHLPQFLRDFIASELQKNTGSSETLKSRFKELMVRLGLRAPSPTSKGEPTAASEEGQGLLPFAEPPPEGSDGTDESEGEIEKEPPDAAGTTLPASARDLFGDGKAATPISEKKLSAVPEVRWDSTKREDNSTIGVIDANHSLITLYEDHSA